MLQGSYNCPHSRIESIDSICLAGPMRFKHALQRANLETLRRTTVCMDLSLLLCVNSMSFCTCLNENVQVLKGAKEISCSRGVACRGINNNYVQNVRKAMDEQGGWGDSFYPCLKTCPYACNITCSVVALTSQVSYVYAVESQFSAECFKEDLT